MCYRNTKEGATPLLVESKESFREAGIFFTES